MVARGRQQSLIALAGGIVAGLFGGLIVSLYSLLTALITNLDPWGTLKSAAAPLLGERAFARGFDAGAVVLGLLVHFAISIVWGAVFGLLAYGASVGGTLLFGAAYGLLVWIVMSSALLPALGLGSLAQTMPVGPAIIEHVVFGIALGVGLLPFQRRARLPFV